MGRPQPGEIAIGIKLKSEALQESIKKRISFLRSMIQAKTVPESFTPRSVEAFLDWEDKKTGIIRIGSAATVKKHDLPVYMEMKRLLKQLRVRQPDPNAKHPPAGGASPLQHIKELKRLNQSLTDDLLRLRVGFTQLLDEIAEQAQGDRARAAAARRFREKYGLYLVDSTQVKS